MVSLRPAAGKKGERRTMASAGTMVASPLLQEIFRDHGLSEREIEVANLMVSEGLDNKEISERIYRTIITVKTHASQIYRKFTVKGLAELMALIVRKLCTLK